MKMSDVKVGARLESQEALPFSPIIVTEITERGFKYEIDAPASLLAGPRARKDEHEHYGRDGWTPYRPFPAHVEAARRVIDGLCADPEVWATHGRPSDSKMSRIEMAIADAILRGVVTADREDR